MKRSKSGVVLGFLGIIVLVVILGNANYQWEMKDSVTDDVVGDLAIGGVFLLFVAIVIITIGTLIYKAAGTVGLLLYMAAVAAFLIFC